MHSLFFVPLCFDFFETFPISFGGRSVPLELEGAAEEHFAARGGFVSCSCWS